MPACESAEMEMLSRARDSSARVPLDALVALIAKRLLLGVHVAAAKFVEGRQIDDPIREKAILDWVVSGPTGDRVGREAAVVFFRDQIVANKILQRGLHSYWHANRDDVPDSRRDLTEDIRPQFDAINKHMLLLLQSIPHLSRDQLTVGNRLLEVRLGANPYLRPLGDTRHEAAHVALRSLRELGLKQTGS